MVAAFITTATEQYNTKTKGNSFYLFIKICSFCWRTLSVGSLIWMQYDYVSMCACILPLTVPPYLLFISICMGLLCKYKRERESAQYLVYVMIFHCIETQLLTPKISIALYPTDCRVCSHYNFIFNWSSVMLH